MTISRDDGQTLTDVLLGPIALKLLLAVLTAVLGWIGALWSGQNDRMEQIKTLLVSMQVTQAVTSNDVSTFKSLKAQRDAELAEVHRSLGELQARTSALEALQAIRH